MSRLEAKEGQRGKGKIDQINTFQAHHGSEPSPRPVQASQLEQQTVGE